MDVTFLVAELAALTAAFVAALYTLAGKAPPPFVELFTKSGPLLFVTMWLQKDARRTRVGAVPDLGLFVLFGWPVVIPCYAFKTRGRAGWRLTLGLFILASAGSTSAFLVAYLTGRL